MIGGRSVASALVALALLPACVAGQEDCEWVAPSGEFAERSFGATVITTVQTPALRCADGTFVRADSARFFRDQEFYQLFGRARLESPESSLDAEVIRMWRANGRVEAERDVRLVRKSDGAVVTGEDLEFLQAGGGRDVDQMTVTGGRPHVTVPPERVPDGGDEASADPFEIDADRLLFRGEDQLIATGNVEMERDSLRAFSEVLEYDRIRSLLALRRGGRVVTSGTTLVGDSIRGTVVEDVIHDLTAYGDASLVGEEVRLAGPRIFVEMEDGEVRRVQGVTPPPPARPSAGPSEAAAPSDSAGVVGDTVDVFDMEHPPRPVATSESFRIVANTIDVEAPGGTLDRLVAVGAARGESLGRDSLNTDLTPEIARSDWLRGDTIVASFERVPAPPPVEFGPPERDSVRDEYRLRELVARSAASSLYRLPASDTVAALPPGGGRPRVAIHYAVGDTITIEMREGEVERMVVVGRTAGWYADPVGGVAPPTDTVRTPGSPPATDSTPARPDSGRVVEGVGGGSPSGRAPVGRHLVSNRALPRHVVSRRHVSRHHVSRHHVPRNLVPRHLLSGHLVPVAARAGGV